MIYTTDNYTIDRPIEVIRQSADREKILNNKQYFCIANKNPKELFVSLGKYKIGKENILFTFIEEKEQDDELIIVIEKRNNHYVARTGNFIGRFTYDGLQIDIRSRFPDTFLQRMLNYANDVYLDDMSLFEAKEEKNLEIDYSKYVLYYMFIQKLEKAFLLGLPKTYTTVYHHEMKLKGNIHINRFIKHDIPFKGKISSVSREQREIQEIIDVLYKAVSIIDKEKQTFSTKNISHIKTHLKQYRSKQYISNVVIQQAINSKALQNPIFSPYKSVLEYAKLIIESSTLREKEKESKQTFGFLVNVANLFEIYLYKLIQKEFLDWKVEHEPNIELYPNNFYERKIKPDIVMIRDKQVIVFDAKYKRMLFRGRKKNIWDVDRDDFFQIHTYMSYYQNKGYEVLAGGLLYPMEGEFTQNDCYSENWLGNDKTSFIVDGIDLYMIGNDSTMLDIKKKEDAFIVRLKRLIEDKE